MHCHFDFNVKARVLSSGKGLVPCNIAIFQLSLLHVEPDKILQKLSKHEFIK